MGGKLNTTATVKTLMWLVLGYFAFIFVYLEEMERH